MIQEEDKNVIIPEVEAIIEQWLNKWFKIEEDIPF
jgi:uncharacterized protein YbaR (Trm112 family)